MLTNKTAVVTGASRGIGKEIAIKLASLNANVVVNYYSDLQEANEVVSQIEELGSKAVAVQGDVSKFEDAKKIIDEAVNAFGKIDILVNNAGITKDNLIIKMKEEDFDRVIATNLKGCFNCCKHASRLMLRQKSGCIINLASIVGVIGNAGQSNYAASKAGVIGITKSLAKELASRGITVNAVAPGFIETEMTNKLSENAKKAMLDSIPLKRAGQPQDIANVVAFLATKEASYITGQVINIDGGMVI
ncbi:3-oxoacyl-[acyl-carrier-protein] reductase [Abyssisolibacter fermentans]|uniref:3-oxoacyl-[acyl-carrier-protein] reductase n=1 Tax=Abyssisolibacter fermentans TaxID=1766203 RepID=UPI00083054A7|nr:3-oxoacyl-[acyl-carrier-protein] reductase [Abyssisolibacter fermentans]